MKKEIEDGNAIELLLQTEGWKLLDQRFKDRLESLDKYWRKATLDEIPSLQKEAIAIQKIYSDIDFFLSERKRALSEITR